MNSPRLARSSTTQGTDNVHYTSTLSMADALTELAEPNNALAGSLSDAIEAVSWSACYWECPPVTCKTWEQTPFEFMLIDAPYLASRRPNPAPFDEHIAPLRGQDAIAVFHSLGKDAVLVAPAQNSELDCYTHVLPFIRRAPTAQVQRLWEHTGQAAVDTIKARDEHPTWLSTAGGGVDWLHIRLDSRPKYYKWQPYRQWAG